MPRQQEKKEVSRLSHDEEEDGAAVSLEENVCPNSWLLASLLSADGKENARAGKRLIVEPPKTDINLSGNEMGRLVSERRPSSPELHELIDNARKSRRKRDNTNEQIEEAIEESDLDLSTSLTQLAVNMNILAPHSQLLDDDLPFPSPFLSVSSHDALPVSDIGHPIYSRTVSSSAVLKDGPIMASDQGWSGSESEEDGWNEAMGKRTLRNGKSPSNKNIRSPSSRRNTTPTVKSKVHVDEEATPKFSQLFAYRTPIPNSFLTSSISSAEVKRLSEVSSATWSTTSTTSTRGPITPLPLLSLTRNVPMTCTFSSTSTASSMLDDFPWDASSPPISPIRKTSSNENRVGPRRFSMSPSLTTSDEKMVVRNRKATTLRSLPRPLRDIEGWGEPEILLDGGTWGGESSPDIISTFSEESKPVVIQGGCQSTSSSIHSKLQESKSCNQKQERNHDVSKSPSSNMRVCGDEVELHRHVTASSEEQAINPDIWAGEAVGRLMDEGLDELLSDFDF